MPLQRTIKQELVLEGRGLHTDKHAVVRLKPAPRDSGVVFYRSDLGAYINAHVTAVTDTAFATTIGSNGTRIKSVEHLLAAVSGLNIDNILIEVNGPEIPALDGSSAGFVDEILKGGLSKQTSPRSYIKVLKPVLHREGNAEISLLPYDGRKITYQIYFDHRLLGHQQMSVELGGDTFKRELAPARTFGFLRDVEYLKSRGLARGGSLDNAIVLDDTDIVNASGLRFQDEFIRHKILDLIGDFSLLGFPIFGHVVASRSGHKTNFNFMKKFLASPDCWQIVSGAEQQVAA